MKKKIGFGWAIIGIIPYALTLIMSIIAMFNGINTCLVIASYTICEHKRNLKDYQIKIIVESKGLVGLCLVSDFLTGKKQSTIDDYVYLIDYLVNKFGIDYFAIGTDFYGTKHLPKGINNYKILQFKLTKKLTDLGYLEEDIAKLFYKNAENFFA